MLPSTVRKPAVAGQFYSSSAAELNRQIASFIEQKTVKVRALGCVLPHAGYLYSGAVAAKTLAETEIPDKVLLIGPNHTGYGLPVSMMTHGAWQTPFGEVPVDAPFAEALLSRSRLLKEDSLAHQHEHSLEVELPLLQFFKPAFSIVPITLGTDDFNALKELGREIAGCIKELRLNRDVLIIASSDMTHYEPQSAAQRKDRAAIDAIIALDEAMLFSRVRQMDISMCGWPAVVVLLTAVKELGGRHATLVTYRTSGDTTGDYDSVVGYAGVLIT